MYNYTVMRQVPPRIVKFDYTAMTSELDRKRQVPLMSARLASRTPNDRRLMDRVQLPSPCTTTSTTVARTTTSPTTREQLLPLRTRSAPNARFEGITPRRRPWTECMCCMRCTLCLHRVRNCRVHVSPRCHATILWEPGIRDHPTFYRMSRSRHFSFCTGISMSYRNRYVAVASFSDSLPWHPFLPPR